MKSHKLATLKALKNIIVYDKLISPPPPKLKRVFTTRVFLLLLNLSIKYVFLSDVSFLYTTIKNGYGEVIA